MSEWPVRSQRPRRPSLGAQDQAAESSTEPVSADPVQRAAEPGQSAVPANGSQPSGPTAEEVADRVYELLLQDLHLENERLGR